jgi:rusticyanin
VNDDNAIGFNVSSNCIWHPTDMSRTRTVKIVLITALVVVAGVGGFTISRLMSYSYMNYATKYRGSSQPYRTWSPAAPPANSGNMGNMSNPPGDSTGFSSPSLAASIAKRVGTSLAGRAPQTVSTSQAKALAEQSPSDASINRSTRTITFTASTVSFTAVAIPPFGPDMTFGIAGLTDPTIIVPVNAQVTVHFINADTDEAHGWIVTTHQPPFTFGQTVIPAIPGAFAGILGDPTPSGDAAETLTFRATTPGTYQYLCPMPGHAQMGMHAPFIVH